MTKIVSEIQYPNEILKQTLKLLPEDSRYQHCKVIERFGDPKQPLHLEPDEIELGGVSYQQPLILPIYNGQLELIQCAILQINKPVMVFPDGLAKGFAYFGDLQHDQPVIITDNLEAFFKIAQTGYAVVLVILPQLCQTTSSELKACDSKQIQYVINLLAKAGYKRLYMPVRPEHIKLEALQNLEQKTSVRLLNQHIEYDEVQFLTELRKDEAADEVSAFISEAIELLPDLSPIPKGHLAKPMQWENGYFYSLETGLYRVKIDDHDKEIKYQITSPIVLLGEARNDKNADWQKYVQIIDKDHNKHNILISYESLLGDALEALRLLVNQGLTPPTSKGKHLLIEYLNHFPLEKRFLCVSRTGWRNDVYVFSNKTFGQGDYVFYSENISPYSTHGSFEAWQQLSLRMEPHKLGVFSFSCAFAGTLIEPLNEESGGFHLYGNSTDGKSTLTKAACSIWGSPFEGQNKFPNSWRTTDNALENSAELRNDNFMVLDELKQASARTVSKVAYMLANNDGKDRMRRSIKIQAKRTWNLIFLSTGEITLKEHLRRDHLTLDAGQELRFAHIQSDQKYGYGAFETLDGFSTAQDLADHIKALASNNYGHVGEIWLEYLVQNKMDLIQQAQQMIKQFIHDFANQASSQIQRVAKRFAIVACAGELATQAKITGWQKGRAYAAVGECFKSWLNEFGTIDSLEDQNILQHIKLFFEQHGSARFEDIELKRDSSGEIIKPRIYNQIGYYDDDSKCFIVSVSMFETEICKGFNINKAKEVLRQHQWIVCENGRYTKRVKKNLPDGSRPTMMHFSSFAMQKFYEDIIDQQNIDVTGVTCVTERNKVLNYNNKEYVTSQDNQQSSSVTDRAPSVTSLSAHQRVTVEHSPVTVMRQQIPKQCDKNIKTENNDLDDLVTAVTYVTPNKAHSPERQSRERCSDITLPNTEITKQRQHEQLKHQKSIKIEDAQTNELFEGLL